MKINCSQAEKMIPAFLKDRLSCRETKAFINHIEHCRNCFDETEVRLMVKYTSIALENDDSISYDLTRLLPRKIRARKKWMKKIHTARILIICAVLLTAAAAAAIILFRENPELFQNLFHMTASAIY